MESLDENLSNQAKTSKLLKSESDSSSSSLSSSEDFFQLDASELNNSTPKASNHGDAQLASEVGVGRGSPMSADAIAATQCPPNQVMGADPYRIPASVFERNKSSSPMEWSVASNESLFSIHVGNASFSKENFFLGRSDELPSPPSLSPAPADSQRKSFELRERVESPGPMEVANAETMTEVLRAAADEHGKAVSQPPDLKNQSASVSRHSESSDGSTASARSFAFPILTEGRNISVKMNPEQQLLQNHRQQQQQESQPQAFETTPNAVRTRWFPCFACCCPFCCC